MFSNAFCGARSGTRPGVRRHARELSGRLLRGFGFRRQRRIHVDEPLHDPRVERLAALLPEQPDRGVEAHGLVVRTLRHQRVEIVDDRQDAGAEGNLLGLEPGGVALAVPAFVVAQDERRHGIGERHAADDFGAHLRVNSDLLEFFLRERPGLREDVLRHGELADVVEEGRRLHALNLGLRHAERRRDAGGVDLHAANVRLRGLILGIDREGERFDRRQVKIRDLLDMPLLVLNATEVDLIGAVNEVDRRRKERGHP